MTSSKATTKSVGLASQWRWLSWALLAVVIASSLLIGVVDNEGSLSDAQRSADIASSIRCPQCTGQSVAESDVAIARTIRADIARRIDGGESDEQIRSYYVGIYGESILLRPSGNGLVGLVWIVPVVAAALATTLLGFAFMRWRSQLATSTDSLTDVSEADQALVDAARSSSSRSVTDQ